MLAISHARTARLDQRARGFSLIELGIVIAVIAVLAAVVIFGRGFIVAGRVSKAVEAANTIRKGSSTYAGLFGGTLTQNANGLTLLQQRQLVPPSQLAGGGAAPAGTPWTVSGTLADGFTITNIGLGQWANQNAVGITFQTPGAPQSQDLVASVTKDPNYLPNAPNPAGQGGNCAPSDPTQVNAQTVTICFNL